MPELNFDSLDAVPEGLREHAKETEDGKVSINVVPKTKLDEFRENNIKVSQERDTLAETMKQYSSLIGDDFNEFQKRYDELQKTHKLVQDGELVQNTSLEEAIAKRTQEMKAELEGKIHALEKDRDAWKTKGTTVQEQYDRSKIDRYITDAVLDPESGARPEALNDILRRAYDVFKIKGDKIVPMEGDQVLYGSDGASPLSNKEWIRKLKDTAPYYFRSSSGGGAGGDAPAGGTGGKFSPEQIAKMSLDEYKKARASGKI